MFAIERNVQALLEDEPSRSASWGALEEASVSDQRGEVVPIPTPVPPMNVAAGPLPLCVTASVGYAVVEEAKRPAWSHRGVVVDCTATP